MAQKHSNPDGPAKAGPDVAQSDPFKDRSRQRLSKSIDEANLLVWYVSQEGIADIDNNTITVIINAQEKFYSNEWNAKEESLFWNNYNMLSNAIAPVSVDSIKASYGIGDKDKNCAKRTIFIYSGFTLFILFGLIILQAYWFIGTSMQTDIQRIRAALQESQINAFVADQRIGIVKAQRSLREIELDNKKNQLENFDKEDASQERIDLQAEIVDLETKLSEDRIKWKEDDIEMEKTRQNNQMLIVLNQNKLYGNDRLLDFWDFYSEKLEEYLDNSAKSEPTELDQLEGETAQRQEALAQQQRREISLLMAKSVLAIFNQYVLPLLYGLLGALAYILRRLTREIQEVTYTRDSNVRYRLRWPLGMLAGVTIGWFFDPETLKGAATITPLGLAFLAGYSVELVFAGLDRIVGAFTGPQGRVKAQAGT